MPYRALLGEAYTLLKNRSLEPISYSVQICAKIYIRKVGEMY